MLNLTFTGVGSAFNPDLYNTSCHYTEGNKMLLIDCGSDIYRRLTSHYVIDQNTDIYVCITHTHQDHIGSLGTLIADYSFIKGKKITLVLDDDFEYRNQIYTTLRYAGVEKNRDYLVRDNLQNVFAEIDDVSFFDVSHNSFLRSKGYIFYLKSKELFVYSGDSNDITKVLTKCRDYNNYKFVMAYVDCNIDRISKLSNMKPHEFLEDLKQSIDPAYRKLFTAIHYDSKKCRDEAKAAGFNVVYNFTEWEYTVKLYG